MSSQTNINQEALLQQIVSEAGIVKKEHQDGLKKQFQRKYMQHVSMVQYHKLREDRFALSQKKVLDRQHQSIEKTKEFIYLRQNKANYNKSNSLIEKSKRVEQDLNRWEKIVEKNRKDQEKRLKESIKMIQEWNDKMSESSSHKKLKPSNLNKVSSRQSIINSPKSSIKETEQEKSHQNEKTTNPQLSRIVQARYNRQMKLNNSRKNMRVSTQSLHERKNKIDEEFIEKYLIKTGEKEERINEARFIKHYMMERKKKIKQNKEQSLKKRRDKNLLSLKEDMSSRTEILQKKLQNQKIKIRDKRGSLPQISGKATHQLFVKLPGQEWRSKSPNSNSLSPVSKEQDYKKNQNIESSRTLQPSYDRLVMDKLKDVAILVRKGRKF